MTYDIMRLIEAHYVPGMRASYPGDFERDTADALREIEQLHALENENKELREKIEKLQSIIDRAISTLEGF